MIRRPLVSCLALLIALAAWPAAAQKVDNPELYEKSLEVARRALEQYGPVDDPAAARRVADIGYRVAREAGYTAFPLTFHLVDMAEPNAFALPGGQVFVTRGMLDIGLDDDMLAALLGHEVAHVVLNHHLKMQRRNTLLNVLSQALLVGVIIGADNSGPDRTSDPGAIYDPNYRNQGAERIEGAAATSLIVSELLLRSFSREYEDEADAEGQRWAASAGFDPEGANRLFARMEARIPQSKKYGYWRTHPYFEERVRAGEARAKLLKPDATPADPDAFRQRTQAALLAWAGGVQVTAEDRYDDAVGKVSAATVRFVKDEALAAWPRGRAAEGLRIEKLHRQRDAELGRPVLERDYGELVRAYQRQIDQVAELTPDTPFLDLLGEEKKALDAQLANLYPKAREVLSGDVVETSFLERYLSNWPDAPEVPRVALKLGDAYSRLGDQTRAVREYLRAVERAPGSPEAERADRGLKVLAPQLDHLAALEELADQGRDAELATLAAQRLQAKVSSFQDIDNGAEYLERYPEGVHASAVGDRINSLADKLYAEVVLYQAIGDHVKAVERINKILTFAPLSPAADLLRDRAVVEASA